MHSLIFSVLVKNWVKACRPRDKFLVIEEIHFAFLSTTVLMNVYRRPRV
jgi:hypothetical protein